MPKPLKSWDNVYTITYKVHWDFPFQWEVYLLVCYIPDTGYVWNETITRLASSEIFWSVNTLHVQIIYSWQRYTNNHTEYKYIKKVRQCVHNNLLIFISPISVGSVSVSSLFDRYM